MRKLNIICILAVLLSPLVRVSAQSIYQDAMQLNEIREDFKRFCNRDAASRNDPKVLSCNPDDSWSQLSPQVQNHLKNVIAELEKNDVGALSPPSNNGSSGFGNSLNDAVSGNQNTMPTVSLNSVVVDTQALIKDWHYIVAFVTDPSGAPAESAVLNTSSRSIGENFPRNFSYLTATSQVITSTAQSSTLEAYGTSLSASLTNGIPEADIIMGIVDWTIQRAKEELMQAFLKGWLDKIQADSILQVAFPATLNLLATADLTTILSQGDVWKSAFEQDLADLPDNLPDITKIILNKIPRNKLSPVLRREIYGVVNVMSKVFVQLKQKNTLEDALANISHELVISPDTLSFSERGVVMAEILRTAVEVVQNSSTSVLSTKQILNLNESQLKDYWNLIYVRNIKKIKKAFEPIPAREIYAKVADELPKVQLLLSKTADLAKDIDALISSSTGTTRELNFEDVNNYFGQVLQLLENGLDLAEMVLPDSSAEKYLDLLENVIEPMRKFVMNIVEGVTTKQYGMVVSNSVSLLQILSEKVVKDQEMRTDIEIGVNMIKSLDQWYENLATSTSGSAMLTDAKIILDNFLSSNKSKISTGLYSLINEVSANIGSTNLPIAADAKKFLKSEFKKLKKDLGKILDDLDAGDGIAEIANFFNTYGRFMVNILTAESSEDMQEALEDAAMGTGSYMVKQTSQSSFTVTFLPGAIVGKEIARAPAQIVGANADSLVAGNKIYAGAFLPIGLEFAIGIKCKVIGALGIQAQVADLGALLNLRLSNPSDSVSASSNFGFQQVLAPGLNIVAHFANVPIVLGGGISYTPSLRSITDGIASYELNMIQIGGFVAVDVTVFQLFASKRKVRRNWSTYSDY